MNSRDNETLIVLAGIAVLAVSLFLPMVQQLASEQDVRDVAVKAIEVKDKLLSTAEEAKRVRVTELVEKLAPDVALAEAEMRDDKAVAPAPLDAVARPQEDAPAGETSAAPMPPSADELSTALNAAEPERIAEARPPAPIAPRDNPGAPEVERPGAAGIWEQ